MDINIFNKIYKILLHNNIIKKFSYVIAYGFGIGYLPYAQGTIATILAIPIYLLIISFFSSSYIIIVSIFFVLGILAIEIIFFDLKPNDYKEIVWDEIVGYLITMFNVPINIKYIIVGFIFFRIFDVYKPIPINIIDKYSICGFGIMFDDVISAILAKYTLKYFFIYVQKL